MEMFEEKSKEEIEYQKVLNKLSKCVSCGKVLGYEGCLCSACQRKMEALGVNVGGM